jgi:hypothetical protein
MSRPTVYTVTTAFRVGRGSGRPASVPFSVAFGVLGLGRPVVLTVPLSFAVKPAEPSIYVFDADAWLPSVQRVWTGAEWFPGVV